MQYASNERKMRMGPRSDSATLMQRSHDSTSGRFAVDLCVCISASSGSVPLSKPPSFSLLSPLSCFLCHYKRLRKGCGKFPLFRLLNFLPWYKITKSTSEQANKLEKKSLPTHNKKNSLYKHILDKTINKPSKKTQEKKHSQKHTQTRNKTLSTNKTQTHTQEKTTTNKQTHTKNTQRDRP